MSTQCPLSTQSLFLACACSMWIRNEASLCVESAQCHHHGQCAYASWDQLWGTFIATRTHVMSWLLTSVWGNMFIQWRRRLLINDFSQLHIYVTHLYLRRLIGTYLEARYRRVYIKAIYCTLFKIRHTLVNMVKYYFLL